MKSALFLTLMFLVSAAQAEDVVKAACSVRLNGGKPEVHNLVLRLDETGEFSSSVMLTDALQLKVSSSPAPAGNRLSVDLAVDEVGSVFSTSTASGIEVNFDLKDRGVAGFCKLDLGVALSTSCDAKNEDHLLDVMGTHPDLAVRVRAGKIFDACQERVIRKGTRDLGG